MSEKGTCSKCGGALTQGRPCQGGRKLEVPPKDTITDGYAFYPKVCAQCKKPAMVIVRIGHVRCMNCDN
jgi:hypothetical protein